MTGSSGCFRSKRKWSCDLRWREVVAAAGDGGRSRPIPPIGRTAGDECRGCSP